LEKKKKQKPEGLGKRPSPGSKKHFDSFLHLRATQPDNELVYPVIEADILIFMS